MTNVQIVSVREPQVFKEARIADYEARMSKRKERRIQRRIRERQAKLAAIQSILIILWNVVCDFPDKALSYISTMPSRIYRGALDLMARTIILFLFVGAMLFAFCFFAAAVTWFSSMIPWPAV